MNLFQRLIGSIFPPFKYKLEREGNEKLVSNIINKLPASYEFLIEQKKVTRTQYLSERPDIPGFKFIGQFYPEESLRKYTDKSKNFKLSGIQLYSKRTKDFEDVQLLINDGHISGIQISNSNYDSFEFDLERVDVNGLTEEEYQFPPNDVDLFFQSLDPKNQQHIDELGFMDIQLGIRTYYTVYDMEDGNYIGIDKKQKVYSLVHDAVPMAKLLKKSLNEVLTEIESGEFDVDNHLNERYAKSK
ncbi:MAG: hypothetical protein AAGC88_07275 [Bacteroidota bacterium]